MRIELKPLFGEVPADAENLQVIGTIQRRFENLQWPTVWPGSGLIRRADGQLEIEPIWVEQNLKDCGDYQSRWSWLPVKRRGRFFNLSLFWSFGYYHWMCDVLTRLHTVLPQLTPETQVILPPNLKPWQSPLPKPKWPRM